jgi:hypothetical protein
MNFIKKISNKNINMNSILHNQIVLYIFVFISVVDLMFFASINDIRSLFTLIIVGFLTSFFSKNMIVILFISLVFTHILKYGTNVSEGMENESKEKSEIYDNSGNLVDTNSKKNNETMSLLESTDYKKKNKDDPTINSLQKDFEDFQSIQEKILTGMKEIDPLLTKAESFIEKFEHFKRKQNGGDPDDDD